MSTFMQMKQLVDTFWRDMELASGIKSPNPEDDDCIKAAIIGFSYESATEDWNIKHFDFIKSKLERNYSSDILDFYGNDGPIVAKFACLCYGYLLGMYQAGKIDDQSFGESEAQLPGLIELSLPQLKEGMR